MYAGGGKKSRNQAFQEEKKLSVTVVEKHRKRMCLL